MFLPHRARSLLCLGVAWLALSPAVSQLVRPFLPRGPGASPGPTATRRAATGGWLLMSGAVVAVAAKSLSALLLGPAGGLEVLTTQPPPVV